MQDDMKLAVREALISTRAVAMCPFHPEVTIRIGDDAAETHASYRIANIFNDAWNHPARTAEMARQLGDCADGACPKCSDPSNSKQNTKLSVQVGALLNVYPFLAERRELLTLAARRTHMRLEFLTSSHSRVRLVR